VLVAAGRRNNPRCSVGQAASARPAESPRAAKRIVDKPSGRKFAGGRTVFSAEHGNAWLGGETRYYNPPRRFRGSRLKQVRKELEAHPNAKSCSSTRIQHRDCAGRHPGGAMERPLCASPRRWPCRAPPAACFRPPTKRKIRQPLPEGPPLPWCAPGSRRIDVTSPQPDRPRRPFGPILKASSRISRDYHS